MTIKIRIIIIVIIIMIIIIIAIIVVIEMIIVIVINEDTRQIIWRRLICSVARFGPGEAYSHKYIVYVSNDKYNET